jgi:hypothetical protein
MCIERVFFGDFSSGATEVRECGGSLTSRSEVMGTPKLLTCRGRNYQSAGVDFGKRKKTEKHQLLSSNNLTPNKANHGPLGF